jgi:hypothetical protein
MMRWLLAILMALALPTQARTPASSVVIYRCTSASGEVTLQNNTACPKGSHQQRQVIESPPPMPAYVPPPMPVAAPVPAVERVRTDAAAADTPSTIADKDRLPPPALYQCNTYDNDSYLSETATPEPRCVRLNTIDLQGAANDAGVACEMVTDQCQRVADDGACDAWKRRLRETQAAATFGRSDDAEANDLELERVRRIVRDSTCGK